jgi:hypothetical protein
MEVTDIFIANQEGVMYKEVEDASYEFRACSIADARRYFRGISHTIVDEKIADLKRLLNTFNPNANAIEYFKDKNCKLLITCWTQIQGYIVAGADIICVLEGISLYRPGEDDKCCRDAFEEFNQVFRPDHDFAEILKNFQPDKLDPWDLTKLPQNIRENQKQRLLACREFIENNHSDLLPKMDAICALCQINEERPSKRIRVK